MNRSPLILLLLFSLLTFYFSACKQNASDPVYKGFPNDVGKIVLTKCATTGCHTDQSKGGAGGLSMESWDKLFEGGNGSACIIPFRSDYSTFFSYINTFPDLGMTLSPNMPYKKPALTRGEVQLFKDWINSGAPDNEGQIKFEADLSRKKFYVVNQGCDVVTVFDQQTLLPMRYINVGSAPASESPHMIKISPDGAYWYVIFLAGNYLEKYRTSDDQFVGRALIGAGYWNTFVISSDSKTAFCIDLSATNAKISKVNLNTLTVNTEFGFSYPHGSALNSTDDTLYVTEQTNSSKLYKIPVSDFSGYSEVNLYTTKPSKALNSHEVKFSPDGSTYFVTCQGTSEVRVFQTATDALLAVIPVGDMPSEMSFSKNTHHLFVTCTEDLANFPGRRGSVAVINYKTYALEKFIYTGHQPHGIEVDDAKKTVYVANRNATTDGPAPHHSNACGGRNGNVSFIDLTTLNMLSTSGQSIEKVEVSVDPYSIAIRP